MTVLSRVGPEGLSALHSNSYCVLRENLRLVMITELSTAGGIGLNRLNCSGPTGFQEEYRSRQSLAAPPIPRIAVPRVMHGLHYRIRIRHKYFTSPESPGSGDPDFSYPLTSCASSAVRCLWSRSHFGRMSVKLLADCAADKGQ